MADHQGMSAEEQLASMGQAVITTDPEGVIVYWNAGAERLYGWTAQEVVGRNVAEITVAEVSLDVAAEIMAALRDGIPWSGGFPVRRKDGSTFPALVTDAGIHRDGKLVGIVGLLHDDDRRALAELLDDVVRHPGVHLPVEVRVQAWDDWRWAEAAFTNLLDDPTVRGVVCNLRPSPTKVAKEQAELRARQLETALESRLGIELAKGYLVGRDGVTPDEAFQALRGYARSHHLTIHDVCRRVVAGEAIISPPDAK